MTEENETFNEIERQAKQRKASVHAVITNPYRAQVIEEVAQHIEKLKGFGADTVSGLAIYIREMKQLHFKNKSRHCRKRRGRSSFEQSWL